VCVNLTENAPSFDLPAPCPERIVDPSK
jgi:hypothetical protein